jgi:hypothetical protein
MDGMEDSFREGTANAGAAGDAADDGGGTAAAKGRDCATGT